MGSASAAAPAWVPPGWGSNAPVSLPEQIDSKLRMPRANSENTPSEGRSPASAEASSSFSAAEATSAGRSTSRRTAVRSQPSALRAQTSCKIAIHRASWAHWTMETPKNSDGERVRKVDVHDLMASPDCQKYQRRVGPHVGGVFAISCRRTVSMMHNSV